MRPIYTVVASLLALVATATIGTPTCGADDAVSFTAIPDHNATELRQKFDPLAAYLSERTGITFRYVASTDYQASVEMFKNGDVQLAWFGGLTGAQARAAVPGAIAIAQGAEDPQYKSYFIAHESTGLTRTEEFPSALADFPFTFGSESSTSGRLMPEHFIRRETGRASSEFFEQPFGFSGSHAKTAELVARGTAVKAGVINYKTYDGMVADGRLDPEICRIVWVTPEYPDYNFTAHPGIDERFGAGTIDRIRRALIEMSDPELLASLQRTAIIEAANDDFESIERVAAEIGLMRKRR